MFVNESATAQFRNGKASATIGPNRAAQRWQIDRLTTLISNPTNRETLKVYRTMETPSNYIDGSRHAWEDISETFIVLQESERLLFVWENGTDGSTATVNVTGRLI